MFINQTQQSILVVDDNPGNLDILLKTLTKAGFKITLALDGESAIAQVKNCQPELILLDVMMPKIDGFETYRRLKESYFNFDIPIIFMTAASNLEYRIKAFSLGAVDYITKPFQREEVLARVRNQLQLCRLNHTLKKQNFILASQISQKQQTELLLRKLNKKIETANIHLKAEIEQRKKTEEKLKQEILERQRTELKLKKSLLEKEVLLKEIHHRVKNNLFVVSTLLEFQAEHLNSPEIVKLVENSQHRISSMALIHEQLYSSTNLDKIDFSQYITALVNKLANSYNTKAKNIVFSVNAQPILLNIETANPCGLIINELIANALEHAFGDRPEGNIDLSFQQNNQGQLVLSVSDNGKGFPASIDFYHGESLGLQLICTLTEQLEGKINFQSDRGTKIEVVFSELNYSHRI